MPDITEMKEMNTAITNIGVAVEALKKDNDERLKQIEAKGSEDPLLKEKLEKIDTAITEASDTKERLEKMEVAMKRRGGKGTEDLSSEAKDYSEALSEYMRTGEKSSLEAFKGKSLEFEGKSLSVGSDPDGGFTVRPEISNEIIRKVRETTPMRNLARVITIGSDAYEYPIEENEAASGGWVGETEARAETDSATTGMGRIDAHEQFAEPHATQKILDDSSINIEQWHADQVTRKFRRVENTSFISGNGDKKPQGILTLPAGTGNRQIEQIVSGNATLITADGLIDLQDALLEEYDANASFLMNRNTVTQIRKLKDATNEQYLWQPGLQAGTPDSLLGKPITKGSDMPTIGANALALVYGDFNQAYYIVDRMGMRVLRDEFTRKPFIKFYTTKRTGGDIVLSEAVKIQKISV